MKIINFLIPILLVSASIKAQPITADYGKISSTINQIGPDLVVTNVKVPYIPPYLRLYAGNTIKVPVEVTIQNKGNDLARNGFGIYTVLKFNGKKADGETIPRLQPGQSQTFKMLALVSSTFNGRYIKLTATVDPPGGGHIPESSAPKGGLIQETNENNNTKTVNIKLPVFQRVNPKNLD
ncbi:MAG: hypothetical protein KDC53_16955 [Saprospiraceae bacterium]|nr:hypothetical protein [Saprospiraceae bacterium]